ncbi:uncharacterized protein LOC132394500 isoform X2 [Hypanus sabinus]|uniref:uncharacterized protein LOC132394500 isoform X2 n=1 Tax=Hypanus sabinus TaxID=79690 RepID=UPI0028C506B7|nr:uncharacterized protein LOC132394500 isoform X2 [Hypanus sabinus]
MAMSRGRIPPRGWRGERGLHSIIAFLAYCACLYVYGSLATVSVRGREVNGIVGQSALLPGSCCTPTLCSLQQVEWYLYPGQTPLVQLTRQCSPLPDGPGCNCSDPPPFITPSHKGRVHLYPDNGSLLLWDLRSNDSGVYVITVYCGGNNTVRDNVSLTVHNGTEKENSTSPTTPSPLGETSSTHRWPICLGVIVVVAICLSLMMTRMHRGCGCKSDTTEKIAESNAVSWEELDENQDQNSQVDITYTILQLPLPDSPTTTQGYETGVIYSAPRKS